MYPVSPLQSNWQALLRYYHRKTGCSLNLLASMFLFFDWNQSGVIISVKLKKETGLFFLSKSSSVKDCSLVTLRGSAIRLITIPWESIVPGFKLCVGFQTARDSDQSKSNGGTTWSTCSIDLSRRFFQSPAKYPLKAPAPIQTVSEERFPGDSVSQTIWRVRVSG